MIFTQLRMFFIPNSLLDMIRHSLLREAATTKSFPMKFCFYCNCESFPPQMFCRIIVTNIL